MAEQFLHEPLQKENSVQSDNSQQCYILSVGMRVTVCHPSCSFFFMRMFEARLTPKAIS